MRAVSGAPVGSSGRGDQDKAWADGDRAFARSERAIEREEAFEREARDDNHVSFLGAMAAGHPNANIAPVLGFARSELLMEHDGGFLRVVLGDNHMAGHPNANIAPVLGFDPAVPEGDTTVYSVVPPIKIGPGGDYVNEETPTLWERAVVNDWLLYAALVVLGCVFVFALMKIGGGT